MTHQLRSVFFVLMVCGTSFSARSQEDLLASIDSTVPAKEYVPYAFKSTRVIMSHSIEMLKPGVLDFRILHRFGTINSGVSEWFGLDQATFRMGFDYGIAKNLSAGIGRSTFKKELDGFLKFRLLQQSSGAHSSPVTVVLVGGATVQTARWPDPTRNNKTASRFSYYSQALIGRKFSERFSMQVSPMWLHQNLVPLESDNNDLLALGTGARFKLTSRFSLTADYFYLFDKLTGTRNPLSIGFDIETGGHVFQLHFTNASGMSERAFLAGTVNDWGSGDIQFGFNLSRVFQIGHKKTQAHPR